MNSKSMAGWIGFAGILMLIIGMIDFFQGLIGLFKDDYYVVTSSGYLAVNLTTWSWILMLWGVLLVLAGLGLLGGQGWARWFAIVLVAAELLRPARLPRQQPVPALGADGADAERDRPLRADGALGREQVGHGGLDRLRVRDQGRRAADSRDGPLFGVPVRHSVVDRRGLHHIRWTSGEQDHDAHRRHPEWEEQNDDLEERDAEEHDHRDHVTGDRRASAGGSPFGARASRRRS